MKTGTVLTEFETRAADALRALPGRFSAIKLIELKCERHRGGGSAILARIEIHGHRHTLACALNSRGEPSRLGAAFRELQTSAALLAADAIPIVIAPYLSPESQALCKENKIGFLDFEGNARLTVGDFFIVMRSLPREAALQVSAATQSPPARAAADPLFPNALPNIPCKHVGPVGTVAVPAAG